MIRGLLTYHWPLVSDSAHFKFQLDYYSRINVPRNAPDSMVHRVRSRIKVIADNDYNLTFVLQTFYKNSLHPITVYVASLR